ncbi:MAG: hypothetical protein JO235_25995 [Chroococcidiopsidaceae cyanobacterium CP_BM_RX_35]|nr:hypothetical protein [Chroococcidiopsidaceae cyanobacterium CP_BM_RX_35]
MSQSSERGSPANELALNALWRLLVRHRRLTIDYEALPATSEAFIYAAMVPLMVRRLA